MGWRRLFFINKKIEESYTTEKTKQYDKYISYMADILFIYDRIPFISGVKNITFSKENNIITSESYISKEEIETYIKIFNIKLKNNTSFKLNDERTWLF